MRTSPASLSRFAVIILVAHLPHLHGDCLAVEVPAASGAVSPGLAPSDHRDAADALLAGAVGALEECHSIAAGMTCQVDLFGKQWGGGGDYWEERSGPFPKVRIELKMPLGEKTGAMVQICDGQFLWTYRRLIDDEKLERVDLRRVAAVLGTTAVGTSDSPILGTIGAGGLGGLLRELRRNFRFELDRQADLLGVPVAVLRGRWRPERLANLLPDQKDAILKGNEPNYRKLPRHVPTSVVLMLGAKDFFPYRIEYQRDDKPGADSREESPEQARTLVSVQFEPRDERVGPAHFECRPGGIDICDVTETFIKRARSRATAEGMKD